MRRCVTSATVAVLALCLAGGVSAATATKKATGHSVTGTIEAYDAGAKTLTLKTSAGSTVFKLGADVKVWSGSKSVTADQLASAAGSKATVKYTESGGAKTATSVRVAAATKPAAK